MSTQYRDPPQWKQNATRDLDVKLFKRLEAASVLCDRFAAAANIQLQVTQDHVAAGGDPLEALMGSDQYAKMCAASDAEEKAQAEAKAAPVAAPAPAKTEEPATGPKRKHKYVPRVNAAPFYVLAARAMELQAEL